MKKLLTTKHYLGVIVVIVFFGFMGWYAFGRAHNLIYGAEISVHSLHDGDVVDTPLVELAGVAKNARTFSINDRIVFVSEKYDFKEKALLLPGYNVITLKGEDKFGKKTESQLRVVYQPKTTNGAESITSVSMNNDYGKETSN